MRKILLGTLVLVALLLGACASGQPQIALETENFSFGEVVNGEVVSRDFSVSNTGNSPLIVEAVSTSCGCTRAILTPMTVAPGESAVLHIEFDSGAHGPDLNGEFIRQIFIASNDPQQPEVRIEFTANVIAGTGP